MSPFCSSSSTSASVGRSPTAASTTNPIPRTALLDERFSDSSGVLWSRVRLCDLSRQVRPLTYVHNPFAQAPLPTNWGVWDRQFVTTRRGEAWESTDILASEPATDIAPARTGANS